MIDDFAIIVFTLLYNFDLMRVRVSSSHIMISLFLSSWSYSLINLALIDRSLFIDRFNQLSWESCYSRNLRIKLFSNRERFAKPYSAYSVSSALTISFWTFWFLIISRMFLSTLDFDEQIFIFNFQFIYHVVQRFISR